MLSNQPQLTHVTPTALLGSWVLHPIEGMMSLGTDFEKRVEEPAAKNFVVRKVLSNRTKCKEPSGMRSSAKSA